MTKQLRTFENVSHSLSVIFLWPNVDKFISNPANSAGTTTTNHSDNDDTENNGIQSDVFNSFDLCNFLTYLFDSIERISFQTKLYHFSILASATYIDKVFNLYECRKLFYRRLLVPLPNAFERYQLLRSNIIQCFDEQFVENNKENFESDDCLYQIASQLHGYVPK